MLMRFEGSDLRGRGRRSGSDYSNGHRNVHIAIQSRKVVQPLLDGASLS
jgi:hypothetical protein